MKLGVLMDPIATLHYTKDSTLAMLWEATRRGFELYYIEQKNLFWRDNTVFANCSSLRVFENPSAWFALGQTECLPVTEFDVLLMRKDPPFNLEYIYTTYLLEHAEQQGVLVVNKPQSLRDVNEKFYITWFPECCPPTVVTREIATLRNFFQTEKNIVCKPLDGMGGKSVFHLNFPDENATVVFETLTAEETQTIMAQRYLPAIKEGDKRILMLNGNPVPYALARIPATGELRGNLAAGGQGVVQPLTARDEWICQQVGPRLREKGLLFVGLDVIGDYLTEINVTSPTCIREIEAQTGLNISAQLFDIIAR